jgi:hypothetical protein
VSDPFELFDKIIGEYDNIDNVEGGRLQHRKCGEVIANANLNRESIELLALHVDECKGGDK